MLRHATATIALMATAAALTPESSALRPKHYADSIIIPEHAIVVSGSKENSGSLIAFLYDTSEMHFSEPSTPRFLFLDRHGKVALGIGGYIKGTLQYDFDGAIDDGANFGTFDIPVPANPALRNQFYGNANHSTIFLSLVGKSARFGYYQMYLQTEFSGETPKSYGLKLIQAYLKVGYVTAGLANSTFVDPAAGVPVISDTGPTGEMSCKNILVRYAPRFSDHISAAMSVEVPQATMTTIPLADADASPTVEKINQRVPDIPAYVQYEWDGGQSHVRLSGLFRDLSYRDLVTQSNRFRAGWALQLSGKVKIFKPLTLFYQGSYGRGYGAYINGLGGCGYDLVQSDIPGRMTTPKAASYEFGVRYDLTSKLFLAGAYSHNRVIKTAQLGADSFRSAQYATASVFYNVFTDLQVGLEYMHGSRTNVNRERGHANRIQGLIKFSF